MAVTITSVISRNCKSQISHLTTRLVRCRHKIISARVIDEESHHGDGRCQLSYKHDFSTNNTKSQIPKDGEKSSFPTTAPSIDDKKYNDAKTIRSSSLPLSSKNDNATLENPFKKISVGQKVKVLTRSRIASSASKIDGQSTTTDKEQQHPAHHYIAGGLPCDPRPPPFKLAQYGEESLYTLVLLRHGESEWNSQNRYTGWCDVELTPNGLQEAEDAGRLLFENDIEIDQAFTSVLKRACISCNVALTTSKQHWVPITKTWRLNERHYGALQGYNKDTAYIELNLDQELVMQMRRAYDVRPPRMDDTHTYWHGSDRRYTKLTPEQLERSRAESLKDVADRIMPFYNKVIVPSMQAGKRCLIVAHANTIRTLIKHIDQISDEDIKSMTIPTGIPLLYRLDQTMKPVDPHIELEFRYMVEPKGYTWGTSHFLGFHGIYLGDLERLQEIQHKRDKTNRDWQCIILRNIGKSLGWEMEVQSDGNLGSCNTTNVPIAPSDPSLVVETRQLWWQVHNKLSSPDYKNMLLLVRMEEALEAMMHKRNRKYITKLAYENLINKIHLDTKGIVVEPFVELADRKKREQRQKMWFENMALEMEEECLIK